jgi:hypothetical protein
MRRAPIVLLAVLAPAACGRARRTCEPGARVALVAPAGPVGFDTPFVVEAKPLCPEAGAGTLTWRQVDGAPAGALAASNRGFRLAARTPALAQAVGAPLPWGVVPLSPRTRGEVALEATWSDGRGHEERHEVRVAAAPRSRGLPNSPVGARAYLGGEGWRLDARPPGSAAALSTADGATSLLPDVAGDWRVVDGAGRALTLRAARYDETPLDCGRAGCHPSLATASAGSPMTTVLARGLSPAPDGPGALFGAGYPDCALACHATGERGIADGGFTNVMAELGIDVLGPRRWEAVPRALRRLGGVGCLACHGPGALPEASARWAILRTDVCATCHDAAPRYGHVAAWRATRMARADHDARTARESACARCHTTAGFLASLAERDPDLPDAKPDRRPPPELGPQGLACATCHAVHEHGAGDAAAQQAPLLRTAPPPASLGGAPIATTAAKSRVCLACHAPAAGEGAPAASAASLWLGRGGVDPQTGAPLAGPAPHARIEGGCVGCHRVGPAGLERGAGHAFATDGRACAACHPRGVPADDLRARAASLWASWRARSARGLGEGEGPPHARGAPVQRGTPLGRAAWNVALVLEDPAAAAHNAPYARMLLAAAEKTFNGAVTPARRP